MSARLKRFFLVVALLAATGCHKAPREVRGILEDRNAVLQTPGFALAGQEIKVFDKDSRQLAEGKLAVKGGRTRVPVSIVELRYLPEALQTVKLGSGVALLERGKPPPAMIPPAPPRRLRPALLLYVALYGFLAYVVVSPLGLPTGGIRGHAGDLPMMVNGFHLVLFLALADTWSRRPFYLYLGLLLVALVLSLYKVEPDEKGEWPTPWGARAAMIALYIGMCRALAGPAAAPSRCT